VKDEPQNRPPWLRNLRPRQEAEAAAPEPVVTLDEPVISAARTSRSFEAAPLAESPRSQTRRYVLLLAVLLWTNVAVLGCLCMLATERIVP
jgi:hypothetical protein